MLVHFTSYDRNHDHCFVEIHYGPKIELQLFSTFMRNIDRFLEFLKDTFFSKFKIMWLLDASSHHNCVLYVFNRKAYKAVYACRESTHNKNKPGADCGASIVIEIKLLTPNTIKKDIYLRRSPALQGIVSIYGLHSHSTQTTAFLTRLHPLQTTANKLSELFDDGHGPTSARAACIDMVKVTSDQPAVSVIRGDFVPTKNSVAHSYRKFRSASIGTHSTEEQLEKLRGKVAMYEKAGKFSVGCNQCYFIEINSCSFVTVLNMIFILPTTGFLEFISHLTSL